MNAQRRTLAAAALMAAAAALVLALLRPGTLHASSMTFARSGHSAAPLLDGTVLVVGGTSATGAELYNPATDSWSLTGATQASRDTPALVRLPDGRVLAVGGTYSVQWAEIYDPATRRWSRTSAMDVARRAPGAALLADGRVVVVGGVTGLASNEIYDPAANTWTLTSPNPAGPRSEGPLAATLADGRVFVVGGKYDLPYAPEIYDPKTDTWQIVPADPRLIRPAMVMLAGGRPLVVSGAPERYAARFDPATGALEPAAAPPAAAFGATLTLLADGRVLLAGGLNVSGPYPGQPDTRALIYDPAVDRWFVARPPATPRFRHSATLLADGRVLFAGGVDLRGTGGTLSSAELYDPAGAAYTNELFMPLQRVALPTFPPMPITVTPTPWIPDGPTPTPWVSPGPTVTPRAAQVRVVDVVRYDANVPDSEEYVQIANQGGGPASLEGWRLVNASQPAVPAFVFPAFTLKPDFTVVVWSNTGADDLDAGDFFWNRRPPLWSAGDRAELRDSQGDLVHAFTVQQ
jgi:hypothetical protein